MFGLMKPRSCSGEKQLSRRLNYCGTCKTMGRLYGQKSRFLLNHDTVFLSELLSVISNKVEEPSYWAKAYHSYNCFSLPKNNEEMPIELQFAATATVILTNYKLDDHIIDSKHSIWLIFQKLFSKNFREASKKLKALDFPLEEMEGFLLSQSKRENESFTLSKSKSSQEILDYLAEPTAKATALFFEHGAKLVNKPSQEKLMYQIGLHFGTIAYLIDAYEDYKKDLSKGEFNALKVAFNGGKTLSFQEKSTVSQTIWNLAKEINDLLSKLEIHPSWVKYFSKRLEDNLSLKLIGKLPVLGKTCNASEKMSFSVRKNRALSIAKTLASNYQTDEKIFTKLFSSLIATAILPIAFLLPKKTAKARTYQDFVGILFNLISLKMIFREISSFFSFKYLFLVSSKQEKKKKKKESKSNCKDYCDCGSCDCNCLDHPASNSRFCRGCKACKVDYCCCDGDCGCCGCDCCPCDGDCCCGCDC
ncbi:MAG: DUF5685 family protein [Blastocatellia bacterium]